MPGAPRRTWCGGMGAGLKSDIAAAELAVLIAATFFVVYWRRGGRSWLLPAGIAHLFIAADYIYLIFFPPGGPFLASQSSWISLLFPWSLIAANGFLLFGLLQLLGYGPRPWHFVAGTGALAAVAAAAHYASVPLAAFYVSVVAGALVGSAIGILMIARGELFYVIFGVLFLMRSTFLVVASYFAVIHLHPELVDLLTFVNFAAVVGDGFGLILIEYDDTRRQLIEVDRGKTAFLASISHELRTPLNAIIGFAELVSLGPEDAVADRYRGYGAEILASGRRLLGITNQVLEMAQVEMKRMPLDRQRLDLAAVVRDAVKALQPVADEKGVRTNAELPTGAVEAVADLRALRLVVANLIDNAIKFSPAGGEIEITVATNGRHMASLTVADQGIGMSADDVQKIFKPYWQSSDVYARRTGGMGLGLAIAQKLVSAMGGKVLVDSALGRGSTFTVLLPAASSS